MADGKPDDVGFYFFQRPQVSVIFVQINADAVIFRGLGCRADANGSRDLLELVGG